MKRTLRLVCVAALLASIVVIVPSADAKKKPPIPFSSCTLQADQAGRTYRMTTGTTCGMSLDGVVVSANNVTIDLGGFRLKAGSGSVHGVFVDLNITGTRIKHGVITGFSNGIDGHNAGGTIVDGIKAVQNGAFGIFIGPGIVRNSMAVKNNGTGIDVHGRTAAEGNGVITNSLAADNTSGGMIVTQTVTGLIDHSTSIGNAGRGITSFARSGIVRRSTATGNQGEGIYLDGTARNTVDQVHSDSNGGQGVSFDVDSVAPTLTRSRLLDNGKNGTSGFDMGVLVKPASGAVVITSNTVDGSYGDGIVIPTAAAFVNGNTANANGWGTVSGDNFGINSPNGHGSNHAFANDGDNQCVDDVLC